MILLWLPLQMFVIVQIFNRTRGSSYNTCSVFHFPIISRDFLLSGFANICMLFYQGLEEEIKVTVLHYRGKLVFFSFFMLRTSSVHNMTCIMCDEPISKRMNQRNIGFFFLFIYPTIAISLVTYISDDIQLMCTSLIYPKHHQPFFKH